MSEKSLTVATFEPSTIGVYIDGELHTTGETYMLDRILCNIIESDRDIDTTTTEHFYYEKWEGVPQTLKEAEEIYESE